MSDFAYRLSYVVICCALMLGLWFAVRWVVYGVSDDFGIGIGLGFAIGVLLMYAVGIVDKRNAQRRSRND